MSSYFPVEQRAAGVGFIYNVGALGGAIGPVMGASLAKGYGLGSALGVLSVGFGLIVVLGVGLNLPRKLQALINPKVVRPEDGDDRYINSEDLFERVRVRRVLNRRPEHTFIISKQNELRKPRRDVNHGCYQYIYRAIGD